MRGIVRRGGVKKGGRHCVEGGGGEGSEAGRKGEVLLHCAREGEVESSLPCTRQESN